MNTIMLIIELKMKIQLIILLPERNHVKYINDVVFAEVCVAPAGKFIALLEQPVIINGKSLQILNTLLYMT